MTFGFVTIVDLLSWTAVILMAIKLAATIILLARGARRHQPLPGPFAMPLWWATKITPVIAVPCLIAIALIENRMGDLWIWSAMMVFVAVMVPVMIWKRFRVDKGGTTVPTQPLGRTDTQPLTGA